MTLPENKRRLTLGDYLDKLLLASLGVICIWVGVMLRELTGKVGALCEQMAAVTVELKDTRARTDELYSEFRLHQAEDRQRYTEKD